MPSLNKNTVAVLLFWFVIVGYAQQKLSHNNNVWWHYLAKNNLNEKLSITLETTMRYTDGVNQKQQYFVRPSVDYAFTKAFQGSVGFTHYNTYVYGNPALNKVNSPENHVWIQGVYKHKINAAKFTHRLRDENRFVGIATLNSDANYEISHYEYRNRMRYMILCSYPLYKTKNDQMLFLLAGNEVFLNIGSNAGKTLLNQNRMIGGVGFVFNKNHQIQLSYIHQNIWNFPNTILENNPTVRLTYITEFDFY
jgi:hypothetical protein